jgi:hypothetical protein
MGLAIEASRDNDFPYPLQVRLECDAAAEFFCRGFETFSHQDGFVGAHADAMKTGWLERQAPEGRIWLCPACSGKAAS